MPRKLEEWKGDLLEKGRYIPSCPATYYHYWILFIPLDDSPLLTSDDSDSQSMNLLFVVICRRKRIEEENATQPPNHQSLDEHRSQRQRVTLVLQWLLDDNQSCITAVPHTANFPTPEPAALAQEGNTTQRDPRSKR